MPYQPRTSGGLETSVVGLFLFSYSGFVQKEMEIQVIRIVQVIEMKLKMDEKEHGMFVIEDYLSRLLKHY